MPTFRSLYATGHRPVPSVQGAETVAIKASVTLPASYSINDLLEFFELPENAVPVDFVVDSTDIDNGTAVLFSIGAMNAGRTDLSTDAADGGAVWIATTNIGQAGGMVRPTTVAAFRVAPSNSKRMIGGKITTGAGTPVAGTITVTMTYRAAHHGV